MSTWFILLAMVFLHVIDDYCLQAPSLCNLKQRSWWEQNAPGKFYANDYLWALFMHGFSWSFMVMLPIAVVLNFNVDINFFLMVVINAVFHAGIDDLKANKHRINLWMDQICHMGQIVCTLVLYALEVF